MSVQRRKQALISLFSILSILTLDQCSKHYVHIKFKIGETLPLIKNVLHITLVYNTGSAFGLFKNNTSVFILISVVAIAFISVLICRVIKKGDFRAHPVFNSSLIIIVAGALGNLIDRLRFGYVIDFIDVRIWPVFNIADSSITIGSFLLLFSFILDNKNNRIAN